MPVSKNNEQYFQTNHLKSNLKQRSIRGGLVRLTSQITIFAINLVSLSVLARLLTPDDFGLIEMVAAFTFFIIMIKEMGLSWATVQQENLTHPQISTLFWVNMSTSLGFVLFAVALSPLLARFYNEPKLVWLTVVLSGTFITSGLAIQHQALLIRQMRFSALTTVEITSKALAVAVAIILARRGAGYWTLAVMQLVDGGARAVGVWIACGWRPGPPKRRVGLRAMIVLGGNLTGSRILDYLTRNLDNVLIGWRWGARETGLYTRAYKILLLPINQINVPLSSVALPALTRLKNDPDRFNNYYLNVLWVIAFITMPLVALMFVLSKEIIDLVLGPQWGGVVLIFRFLCLSALFEPILSVLNWLYMSTGRTDRMFKWGMVTTIIMVISFFIGLPYGARGVALAYSLTTLILVVPSMAYATSHTRMDIKDIIVTIRPALLATLVAGTAGLAFKHLLNLEISIWIETIISGLMMMTVYLIITLGFYGKRDFLIDFFKEVFHQGQSAST